MLSVEIEASSAEVEDVAIVISIAEYVLVINYKYLIKLVPCHLLYQCYI
jgi:hypothetical protein